MTYCKGCSYLVYNTYILGEEPVCLRFAEFQRGYIRPRVDLTNVWRASSVNAKNDCQYKRLISLRAWSIKRWLKKRTERATNVRVQLGRETYREFSETEEKRRIEEKPRKKRSSGGKQKKKESKE